jgi:phosphatidylglycerophosphatase GEP4
LPYVILILPSSLPYHLFVQLSVCTLTIHYPSMPLVSLTPLVRRLTIQAEAVSLSLSAPILIHPRPKPGCSKTVLSYFQGELGKPTTLRGQLRSRAEKLREEEEGDEDIVVGKWKDEINGPILGPLVGKDGKPVHQDDREKRDLSGNKDEELGGRMRERQHDTTTPNPGTATSVPAPEEAEPVSTMEAMKKEDLRILVIGDRMFTDTLLANRLSKLLPNPSPPTPSPSTSTSPSPATTLPSVLSIHTTLLLQPSDVRILRWIEELLTRGRVREGPIDWARYTRTIAAPALPVTLSWRERINPFRDTPPLTWSPKTWRPKPLLAGTGLGLVYLSKGLWMGVQYVGGRVWEGEVEVAKAMAAQAEAAKAEKKVMEVKEGVASAVHDVGTKKL